MTNNLYYNINFAQYGVQMLTTNLRVELGMSFVKAIMAPLDDLHAQFTIFRNSIDYKSYSQVCYMQGLLNDYFDPLERRIRVKNSFIDEDSYYYWLESKEKSVETFKENTVGFVPRIENEEGQIGSTNSDFDVVLPKGFALSEEENTRMRNIINQSKLASKLYTITNG